MSDDAEFNRGDNSAGHKNLIYPSPTSQIEQSHPRIASLRRHLRPWLGIPTHCPWIWTSRDPGSSPYVRESMLVGAAMPSRLVSLSRRESIGVGEPRARNFFSVRCHGPCKDKLLGLF